jgi:chromosome partitioning protein
MAIIISVLNHKGGAGKTTTAVNLGAGLARTGKRVLLIDLDYQANATQHLAATFDGTQPNIFEVITNGLALAKVVVPTSTPGLTLAPAGDSMVGLEARLPLMPERERTLKRVLNPRALKPYDVVLIDLPPGVLFSTVAALVASTHYLVPAQCQYFSIKGFEKLRKTLAHVHVANPDLKPLGVVLTLYDARMAVTKSVADIIREQLSEQVFSQPIRINAKFPESTMANQSIFEFENNRGKGTEDFAALTSEVLRRLEVSHV